MKETTKIYIKPMKRKDVKDVVRLEKEFDEYLARLSKKPRRPFSIKSQTKLVLRDGFGKNRAFQGFIARRRNDALGYVIYHQGYDPDEIRGRVIHVVDLFVTNRARRLGVGSLLMKAVANECQKIGGTDIYFGVWLRNKSAIKFYKKLGADRVKEVPFMRWDKKHWKV